MDTSLSHTANIPRGLPEFAFRCGYGTYEPQQPKLGDTNYTAIIRKAIEIGYRHIDSAQDYDTEELVGNAIDQSDIDRNELFITTKLRWDNLSYENAIKTAKESRDRLGIDTIDLLYVHVPTITYNPVETLPALDKLVNEGIVDKIGLSNCTPDILTDAIERLETPVFAHQVEMHPLLHQESLHQLAIDNGHWLIGFSPYMRGMIREISELQDIADKHDVTPFEVSRAWLLGKRNVGMLSHSTNGDHMRTNLDETVVSLDPADIDMIDSIDREYRIWSSKIDPWNRPDPDY
ncbi:MAG: aldo/keto reductase [Halobacteriaceae archaeon]